MACNTRCRTRGKRFPKWLPEVLRKGLPGSEIYEDVSRFKCSELWRSMSAKIQLLNFACIFGIRCCSFTICTYIYN